MLCTEEANPAVDTVPGRRGGRAPATQDADVRQLLEKPQAAMQKHLSSLQQAQSQIRS